MPAYICRHVLYCSCEKNSIKKQILSIAVMIVSVFIKIYQIYKYGVGIKYALY